MPRIPLLALLLAAAACDAAPAEQPRLELYVDGTLMDGAATLEFPPTRLGEASVATFELKNLGPGAVDLTGRPPLLLERDDRLAFRVTQPEATRLPAGEALTVSARFVPGAEGTSTARLLIAAAHLAEPLVLALRGRTLDPAEGSLVVKLAGQALTAHDFGAVALGTTAQITLRLENQGEGTLLLGPQPVTLTGPGDAFAVGAVTADALASGEALEVPLSFAPSSCGPMAASLAVAVPRMAPLTIDLFGVGGEDPHREPGITDTTQVQTPDLAVAVSGLWSGEHRRVAVGNLTVGAFTGQVTTFAWDGCRVSQRRMISATELSQPATLFGNVVALSDDGQVLLVTGRNQQRDAWLFSLDAQGVAQPLATLFSTQEAAGHGRGAALAADGSVVLVGQTGASNGINAHGAVFVYERGAAWGDRADFDYKLVPRQKSTVSLVGAWVESAADVVVAGALANESSAETSGPALALVWRRVDGVWGVPTTEAPREFAEHARLVTNRLPADSAARVAAAGDGSVLALAVAGDALRVHLYQREGETWGVPTATEGERAAHAVVSFADRPRLRVTLSRLGDALVVGDSAGVLEVWRPSSGWAGRTIAAPEEADQVFPYPVFNRPALSPDGAVLVGVGADGAAWLVAR